MFKNDENKTQIELMEENAKLFNNLKKVKLEYEELKKKFHENSNNATQQYTREFLIQDILKDSKFTDQEKLAKISEIMKLCEPKNIDQENITQIKFMSINLENNRLVERNALLEQEIDELREQQSSNAQKIEELEAELGMKELTLTRKVSMTLPPPVPPPLLFFHKMHPTEATSPAASGENRSKLSVDDAKELSLLKELLWGRAIQDVVFRFWSQGFELSLDEPSALVQHTGGPCSVIATCQAYILKHLMDLPGVQFKDLTEDKCRKILVQAICNILNNCKESTVFRIVTLDRSNDKNVEKAQEAEEEQQQQEEENLAKNDAMETSLVTEDRGLQENDEIPSDVFHDCLSIQNYEAIEEVEKFFVDNFTVLSSRYGVLLFLYSVLLTKGIEKLLSEVSDTSEPLIHSAFGYGSQSLINLFLTGRAVAHVFDNDQDIGGMKLKGIDKQSDIGFITLMEQLRYCTVGSFYKNPKYPVWIMASETHLTVLFSNEKSLVSPETAAEHARRVFSQYDTENTGFISSSVLQDILSNLGLESDPDYVEIMRKKLDADGTSIILLSDFLYEFFPDDKKSTPDTFELFHYNGIINSNENHKVHYSHGQAILLESHTSEMFSQSNQMLTVLQTKWPCIEINWNQDRVPSLN